MVARIQSELPNLVEAYQRGRQFKEGREDRASQRGFLQEQRQRQRQQWGQADEDRSILQKNLQQKKEMAYTQDVQKALSYLDPEAPNFAEESMMAKNWLQSRHPDMSDDLNSIPTEELAPFVRQAQFQMGIGREPAKEQPGFTLGPKDVRFTGEGKELARGIGEAPKTKEDFAKDFTDEDVDSMADQFLVSGKYPFTGRSADIRAFNAKIKKRAMEKQREQGITAVETVFNQLDKKGMQKDIDAQQVKLGSMRSFIGNIDKQAAKIEEVGKRIRRYDTKLLNIPMNKVMNAVGDADRAVFNLLIGELEEEIGKLASGATNSVAALSEGGREKWAKIFDPNLSYNDMMQLVEESKEVGHMRVDSMKESLKESRKIIRETPKDKAAKPKVLIFNPSTGGFE